MPCSVSPVSRFCILSQFLSLQKLSPLVDTTKESQLISIEPYYVLFKIFSFASESCTPFLAPFFLSSFRFVLFLISALHDDAYNRLLLLRGDVEIVALDSLARTLGT